MATYSSSNSTSEKLVPWKNWTTLGVSSSRSGGFAASGTSQSTPKLSILNNLKCSRISKSKGSSLFFDKFAHASNRALPRIGGSENRVIMGLCLNLDSFELIIHKTLDRSGSKFI